MKKTSFLFAASLFAAPAFGQADECAAATDLGTGPTTATFDTNMCSDTGTLATTSGEQQCFSLSEDVWFKYTAQTTGLASFDTCNNATFDTEIGVWEGADCASMVGLGCNDDNSGQGCSGNTSFLEDIPVTAGQTYYIQIGFWSSAGGTYGAGTLTIAEYADPCASTPNDAFEANDDCASATAVGDGNYPGLILTAGDFDFFSLTVPAGSTLDVTASFIDVDGDIDLYLWDASVACDSRINGEGTANGSLANGFSASDDETIQYINGTGADQDLVLEVRIYATSGVPNCAQNYALDISGAGQSGPGPIGMNYCMANPNSTGNIGVMGANGFASIANNDVTLTATDLPANQFGIFITSLTQGFVPNAGGTSNGNLCVGGAIGRYQGPGQIQNTGMTGDISLVIDLTAMPQGGGSVPVMSGETWNFQAWYRDTGGQGSNFTDGLAIQFN